MRDRPRGLRGAAAVLALLVAGGCAARTSAPPSVAAPRYPDFVPPDVPAELRTADLVLRQDLAWRWLQSGAPRTAERAFASLLDRTPGFYPAEAGLGYVHLAAGDLTTALERFEHVLAQANAYLPALVGRGEVLLALGREEDALRSFEAARSVDRSLDAVRRRVDVLQFRVLQASLSSARRAADAGRYEEAAAAYRQAIVTSPGSPFLYRELGVVERRLGAAAQALEHFQKSVELDPTDAAAWREIGEVLEERQDPTAALAAYAQAAGLDPDPALQERMSRLQAGLALARLPAEYRGVADSPTLTRGELAALVGVRLGPLVEAAQAPAGRVVTDAERHWAAPWILPVIRAGIMDAYPNHTFQPFDSVSRGDLALSASRLLGLIAARRPDLARQWQAATRPIADVPEGNLNYRAVAVAVASGAVPLLDDGTFQPARLASGADAVAAIDRIERLLP